jgi:hypothetical protein
MSNSIVLQLVKKDFLMIRKIILIFGLMTLASIVIISLLFGRVPNWAFVNLGFTLLISPSVTCSVVLLMRTVVQEKEKSTQLFIMSLPVTVKEFTLAKLLVNLPVFFAFWLVISVAAFYFVFGLGVFVYGTIPFVIMIFLGVFIAYISTLSVSLIYQSLGITVLALSLFELGTPAYLWVIAFLEPINSHIYDTHMVWNSTAIAIVTTQIAVAILIPLVTWHIQNKKRDFI